MPTFGEWLDIETAPRDGTQLIVVDTDGQVSVVEWVVTPDGTCFWELAHLGDGSHFSLGRQATHWMPLPPPPTRMMKRPLTREEFYLDDICASVARRYYNLQHKIKPHGWPVPRSDESRKECDWYIENCGGVKEATDEAYWFLANGCGIPG